MQIQVFGNKALLSSLHAETTPAGLQFIVNFRDKTSTYHRVGGSSEFSAQFPGVAPEHQAIEVYPGDIEDEDAAFDARATVVFYADTPEDALVPSDLLGATRSLATWSHA